ncbi:PspA-associated protein PspAA [Nocardioides bruguierae]|uniref:PspA-associated domain-containing protein n=1 Tax=Nocardioides bruguierae TaxID=2945102 RepID=A0A9X2DCZ4_9ACTN|nr:hypothetical protein [Nocardioides bruguierae]MCL8027076.1 hypothetical protein [Nocardioides bruguierae]MCM0622214.1 hypothetical protein [Nocardioides bruguierae]
MIVRILGEGQFDVDDASLDRLNELDSAVEAAVGAGDHEAFAAALTALLDAVRAEGAVHDVDSLDSSDLILPPADAGLEEVRDMLAEDGLIPG